MSRHNRDHWVLPVADPVSEVREAERERQECIRRLAEDARKTALLERIAGGLRGKAPSHGKEPL